MRQSSCGYGWFHSRPDAEHVSEALGRGAARVCGSVLQCLLFGPGHLNTAVMLRASTAARWPLAFTSISVIIVI